MGRRTRLQPSGTKPSVGEVTVHMMRRVVCARCDEQTWFGEGRTASEALTGHYLEQHPGALTPG